MQGLAELAVEEGRWEEALSLLRRHAELAPTVALPYAHWLLAQGRARDAYRTYR
jgi:predicted Zn-dependent protease